MSETKIVVNATTGATEEVTMSPAEEAALVALRELAASSSIVYGRSRAIGELRVQTVNATSAELLRAAVPPLTGYTARLRIIGVADNLAMRAVEAIVVIGRGTNGAAIIQNAGSQGQTVLADHRSGVGGSWAIVPSVVGNDYVITVTGSAGRTVDWRLVGTVEAFTPGGGA